MSISHVYFVFLFFIVFLPRKAYEIGWCMLSSKIFSKPLNFICPIERNEDVQPTDEIYFLWSGENLPDQI